MTKFRKLHSQHPVAIVIAAGLLVRLIAAVFSKGFSMFDDHFLVIESAQSWVEMGLVEGAIHAGHRIAYKFVHYGIFAALEALSIRDPQAKMYVVRVLHAIYSMGTVVFGYLLARELTDKKTAFSVAAVLSLFWLFPFMSVRNLIEFACTPMIMAGFFFLVRGQKQETPRLSFVAGLFFAVAILIRYQTGILAASIAVYLMLTRQSRTHFVPFSIGGASLLFATLGIIDWSFHGFPFASIYNNFVYNLESQGNYPGGYFAIYVLTILGVTIPPTSFLYGFGCLRTWRSAGIVFWPNVAFLFIHSLLHNRQERFILPVVPTFIVLGIIGTSSFLKHWQWGHSHKRFVRFLHNWFWVLNTILLLVVSTTYSKKARVEPLSYLSRKPDVQAVLLQRHNRNVSTPPTFYLGSNKPVYRAPKKQPLSQYLSSLSSQGAPLPNYVVLLEDRELRDRESMVAEALGAPISRIAVIKPTLIDALLHLMNPRHNVNLTSYIYRVAD